MKFISRLSILYVALIISMGLVACGKDTLVVQQPAPAASVTPDVALNSKFEATSSPVIIENLDLSNVVLNTTQSADDVIACDGSFGNSGNVNGVAPGMVRTLGTATQGTIQFGHTKYVGASDSRCRDVSKEQYSYSIEGAVLTLCLTNPAYPYCTTYQKAQ